MAASTSVRPHSSSGSVSSTPWLSPEAPSNAWRGSYSTTSDLSRSASLNAGMNASDSSFSHDPQSQEWWEHVLPPGQLAERLRKAQRSSSSSRRRNTPALANATPSERSAWKRLSGLPTEKRQQSRSESSTAASSRRASFQGGDAATLPRSALKSSLRSYDTASQRAGSASQSESSADVSSDEFGSTSTDHHHTQQNLRFAFPSGGERGHPASSSSRHAGARTTPNSPEIVSASQWPTLSSTSMSCPDTVASNRSFSRSTGVRRLRVMSENGMASALFASGESSRSAPSSLRLPASQSAMHLSQQSASSNGRSKRTSTAADHSEAKFSHQSLPGTPEFSSDDGADVTTFSTTTTQRIRKISITTTPTIRSAPSSKASSPPTILRSHFDRPHQAPCALGSEDTDGYISPASRRGRHVSFDQTAIDAAAAADTAIRGNSVRDYAEPLTSSQSAFGFGRDNTGAFDSLPPRSNSTRRSRHGTRAHGRRATSFSLPGSRRGSIREETPFKFAGGAAASHDSNRHGRTGSIPDAVLLESLGVAQKQLASAGNLAITLTRQLSAPLRPVFHMTLFLSISSITVLSLACFLCASYMLTAWDDVSMRTSKVREVAGRTRNRFEGALDWGRKKLTSNGASSSAYTASQSRSTRSSTTPPFDTSSTTATGAEKRGPVSAAGHAFLWPARMAFSGASMVAHHVTPPSVSKMFSEEKQDAPQQSKTRSGSSKLPPRPPLSTLLPSILFTLLLAIGAGLTSFLASRKAATDAAADARAQPYTVPSSSPGMQYAHFATDGASFGQGAKSFHSMRMNASTGGWERDGGMAQRRPFVSPAGSR